jgi:PIN domain nuclease of toxin-antitoxin system
MEKLIYLDTHLVVWLYAGQIELLSGKVLGLIEKYDVLISPLVALELQYLVETEKISVAPKKIIESLGDEIGMTVYSKELDKIVEESLKYHWTRDPFDRLITAQAALDHSPLLTKDKSILTHYKHAVWS